jgi:nitrate reductase gamma subunit
MSSVILIVTYASVMVFVLAVVSRFVKIYRLPMHLRWELYPVAHEKKRARYGGSYLEELDWWTKPRESSLLGELRVMIPEILLLAGVKEHNLKHWYRSFPFHFGLYLLAGLIALLLAGAVATAAGVDVSAGAGAVGGTLYHLTYILAWTGLGLALLGSLALLYRRSFDVDYREYTKKSDYFNLLFFIVTLGVAVIAHAVGDPYFVGLRTYFERLVTFNLSPAAGATPVLSGWAATEIVLASLLLAYIPLTHMAHFFTKWFMYHDIRWNDEPSLRKPDIEKRIDEALHYPVSWSAPHLRGDGKKNWVDVATSGVEENEG